MNEWGKAKEKIKVGGLFEGTKRSERSLNSNKQLLVLKVSGDQDMECGPWPRRQAAVTERGSLEETVNREERDSKTQSFDPQRIRFTTSVPGPHYPTAPKSSKSWPTGQSWKINLGLCLATGFLNHSSQPLHVWVPTRSIQTTGWKEIPGLHQNPWSQNLQG